MPTHCVCCMRDLLTNDLKHMSYLQFLSLYISPHLYFFFLLSSLPPTWISISLFYTRIFFPSLFFIFERRYIFFFNHWFGCCHCINNNNKKITDEKGWMWNVYGLECIWHRKRNVARKIFLYSSSSHKCGMRTI